MALITLDSPEVQYLCERDWRLAHLLRELGDYEYEHALDPFGSLAHSVIEQMLSVKAGMTIMGRVMDLCGGGLTPESLLSVSVEDIRGAGVSTRKAQTLHALAHAWQDDAGLRDLPGLSDDEVRKRLCRIKGIGAWTADMFLIFTLDRPDVLAPGDGAVRQVFQWLYGAPMTNPEVASIVCDLWHPYASIPVRYFYVALDRGLTKQGPAQEVLGF